MRLIKFRAWDIKRKQMFFPSSISWKDDLMWCGDVLGENRYETAIEKSEVMQFTGLKDKNGREIWEGDIIKFRYPETGDVRTAEVKFITGCFVPDVWRNETPEVIGNIYENPELLK